MISRTIKYMQIQNQKVIIVQEKYKLTASLNFLYDVKESVCGIFFSILNYFYYFL